MPKLHMIDTGLACHLLGLHHTEQLLSSAHYGGLLENYIYMDLVKQATWAMDPVEFYHFRDTQKNEVDLVVEKTNGELWGIEVKAASSVKLADFRGLIKLADYAGDRFLGGFVLYTGEHILPFTQGNIRLYALPIGLYF